MITVRDIVSLETPAKNEAAPTNANAPGSTQLQYDSGSVCTPNHDTNKNPTIRPYKPPMNLEINEEFIYKSR